jgi:hypothetical protein
MEYLSEHSPTYGYYIEPEKTHVICKEEEEPEAKAAFLSRGLVVSFSRGQRYLGGFIGSKGEREKWVREKVEKWADGVRILASIARRYPQTAYAGFTMSLQQEWCYVARTCPDIGALFEPVEKEIHGSFLPALLGVEFVDADLRALVAQGVKRKAGGASNPQSGGCSSPALRFIEAGNGRDHRIPEIRDGTQPGGAQTEGARGKPICSEHEENG